MSDRVTVSPRLSVLTEEQIARIHSASVELLSSRGVRVDSERAVETFEKALGKTAVDGRRVCLSAELVEWAIEAAPSTIDLYSRSGDPAFRLGEQPTRFGIGVTNLFFQDPASDEITPFHRDHMRTSVRLGNSLCNIDLVSTVGVPQDVAPDQADLYATLEMAANTTKPLVILVSEPELFPWVLDMLDHLCGDLRSNPFVIPYVNPVTPLIINRGTSDKMFVAVQRGLPLIYSSYGMAGVSTPITPAGSLILLNAELLAGLALSQLIAEGTPVVLGILPMAFDMKAMAPVFDASSVLLNVACAELMAHYGLPHVGTSGSGAGWGADVLAAGVMWANHLSSVLGQVDMCPFVGSSFGSMAFSPHAAVYADEVIARVRRVARGFDCSEETIGLAEMKLVGPGGDFLSSDRTFELFREATFNSDIFPVLDLDGWLEAGSPDAIDLLRRRTRRLLEHPLVPADHGELLEEGEAFISSTVRRSRVG